MDSNGERSKVPFTVRFVLSTNRAGSMTRITAETASALARQGVAVTVLYPAVDWWDFRLFALLRTGGWRRWKARAALMAAGAGGLLNPRPWCGWRYHPVDPRVRSVRYGITPSAVDWKPDEITIVHPPYLVPRILSTLPHRGIKMVSVLHMNLEKAMASPSPVTSAWYRHWVARERLLRLPRYTTSLAAKEAAERLGIPVRRVIHDGCVDVSLFRPAPERREGPLEVLLYCETNPQKGQRFGVQALARLRSTHRGVRLSSVGRVLPDLAKAFDRNYGYLHREALVKVLQSSDLFVYPSWYDGFPAPPLQALACGAALVTTAVEGVQEYAVHGENALVSPPGDGDLLRAHVVRLIEDPALRHRLQTTGPEVANRFSLDKNIGELLDFLREVYETWETDSRVETAL